MHDLMSNDAFDFGSLVNDQFSGIRHGYKFGKAFNDDKLIVRPKKPVVAESVKGPRIAHPIMAYAFGSSFSSMLVLYQNPARTLARPSGRLRRCSLRGEASSVHFEETA